MQSLGQQSINDEPLRWCGGLVDGRLEILHGDKTLSVSNTQDFHTAQNQGLPQGSGARMVALAYAMVLAAWECGTNNPNSEAIAPALNDYGHSIISNQASKHLVKHLQHCAEDHEHLLDAAQLCARLLMEAKRLHQRYRNGLKQTAQHLLQLIPAGQCAHLINDEHCEPFFTGQTCPIKQRSDIAAADFLVISGSEISAEGVFCSPSTHAIIQQGANPLIVVLDCWHLCPCSEPITDGYLVPWFALSGFCCAHGHGQKIDLAQLLSWGRDEWQASII